MKRTEGNKIILPGGLHTDNSLVNQPDNTVRFALNAVNESDEGDLGFRMNEESNYECYEFPQGFIPIGDVYVGNQETLIFLASAEGDSIIGIGDRECNFTIKVDDREQDDKLGFRVSKQIKATYRLRRGCERTVYWVDPKPRRYILEKEEEFKKDSGEWDISKFGLIKTYSKIPSFSEVELLDSGGAVEPGGYNVAIQYIDEDLNPTEWITTSNTIKVYNDLPSKEYREINGSINSDEDSLNFPTTGKAIKVNLSNLDTSFIYYRLAFICSNVGSGLINSVIYSENIPISKNFYIYTGKNGVGEGTAVEIALFTEIIEEAYQIEQLENMLILGDTRGKQVNFCALQKYASKIKADCVTREVILNDITDPSNPKNPTHEFGGTGYMPGEIYSFGIVWVFKDGSTTPVYHIPGKSPNADPTTVYSFGDNVYPMESENNACQSTVYNDNESCTEGEYWGLDSEGIPLKSKPVRHHRFPLRSKIGLPLVSHEDSAQQDFQFYSVRLRIQGTLITPVPCPEETPGCGTDESVSFEVRVTYTVDGETFSFSEVVDPSFYADGENPSYTVDIYQDSQFHSSNSITIDAIEITNLSDVYEDATTWDNSPYFDGGDGVFSTEIVDFDSSVQGRVHTTQMLGIKFSGIEKPSLKDTNGEEIVGYYIVRNERTQFDKTILDSGVVLPCVVNAKYISHGLLAPEVGPGKLSPNVYSLIHPEHKFNGTELTQYDKIIEEGYFQIKDRKYGKINYDDVYDGSSYNSKRQKDGNDDGHSEDGSPTSRGYDGWSINFISRDNILDYRKNNEVNIIDKADIKERFYLSALEYQSVNDNANEVYNISADNKVGIIQLQNGAEFNQNKWTRYILFYKENAEPYSNFRVLPYYKDSKNVNLFEDEDVSQTSVFNGDSYVTSMRHTSTLFWDNRVAKRKGKSSLLKIIIGAILIVAAVVLAIWTGGSSLALVGVGAALVAAGAGAALLSSGINQANYNKAYGEEYDKGLRQTALDDFTDMFYNYRSTIPFGFSGNGGTGHSGPSDDTIQWIGDCFTDLWFESSINMALRNRFNNNVLSPYLNSPGIIETGNDSPIGTWEFFGLYYTNSNSQRYPVSSLERHLAKKLLYFDPERDDNRVYIGAPIGEYYNLNPDYVRKNKEKIYNHLPLEYDCCADCNEVFSQRWYYSQQAFQEELSDNYRVFLPNNYRDIEGETGKITDIYRIQNNLFIHTEEALWSQPQNFQERITGEVVSFIGTGEYFNIPPRKILDDNKSSAGNKHDRARLKTKYGVLFPSHKEKKWYLFDGQGLNPITIGNENYFKEKMFFGMDKIYYQANGREYPYQNNPSNPIGTGYISTYDTKKERLIITKKDKTLQGLPESDYELCNEGGDTIIFENFSQIVADKEAEGFTFVGIEDCRLKFTKTTYTTTSETREITVTTTVENTSDVIIWLDTSGSFDTNARNTIKNAVNTWLANFSSSNPDWAGNLYFIEAPGPSGGQTERWIDALRYAKNNLYGGNIAGKDIILVSFVNESSSDYHDTSFNSGIDAPTASVYTDINNFVATHSELNSFYGLAYPIVFSGSVTKEYLKHVLAAVKGISYTAPELAALIPNPIMSAGDWNTLLVSLAGPNPYPDNGVGGLDQLGWKVITNRFYSGSGDVITPEDFQADMDTFLEGIVNVEYVQITVEVEVPETTIEYVEGEVFEEDFIDSSWTMSYSLKEKSFISWHSYLPSYYFHDQERFFSWKEGINKFWKHNLKGNYQTFYGTYYPFILEYVDSYSAFQTKIWDAILFQAEAKKWNAEFEEYIDIESTTFNKILVYNSRQISGVKEMVYKDRNETYLGNQVSNNPTEISIDRNERDWTVNELRDIRTDYDNPMFIKNVSYLQSNYFIDKIVNNGVIDYNKDWTQLESFRDKFLVIRLIFDNFDDTRIIMNFSAQDNKPSER